MTAGEKFSQPDLPEDEEDRLLTAFVRNREDAALRTRWADQLRQEHDLDRRPKKSAVQRRLPRRTWWYGGAVAAALALLVLFLPQLRTEPGAELLAQRIESTELVAERSGGNDPAGALRTEMIEAFRQGDYAAAIDAGERLVSASNDQKAKLDLAIAYLRSGAADRARERLVPLLKDPSYRIEALYYAGLADLAAGRPEAGLKHLSAIPATGSGRYYELAQPLLRADWSTPE